MPSLSLCFSIPPLLSSPLSLSLCCFTIILSSHHDEPNRPTPYRPYLLSKLCLSAKTTRILPTSPPPTIDCVCTVGAAIVLVAITGLASQLSRIPQIHKMALLRLSTRQQHLPSEPPSSPSFVSKLPQAHQEWWKSEFKLSCVLVFCKWKHLTRRHHSPALLRTRQQLHHPSASAPFSP